MNCEQTGFNGHETTRADGHEIHIDAYNKCYR